MAVSASKHKHTANQMLKPAVLAGMKDSVDLKEGMVVVAVVGGGGGSPGAAVDSADSDLEDGGVGGIILHARVVERHLLARSCAHEGEFHQAAEPILVRVVEVLGELHPPEPPIQW